MKRSTVTEKWIHSFAVTDVCLHPNKFTVYKVTSVVFPVNIPEALTCLTVWKRFNDIKALLKYVQKRHKEYKLSGSIPTFNNHIYFKRFEADVITERKLFIIRLFDYIAQHPILYKSQVFQEFFARSQAMPNEDKLQFDDESITSGTSSINGIQGSVYSTTSSMTESILSTAESSSNSNASDSSNNSRRCSIEINPNNNSIEPKKFDERKPVHSSSDSLIETPVHPNDQNELSHFKVLKTFGNIMQIQDMHTKNVYIMKSIWKLNEKNEEYYLPSNFPFMASLIAYYESDTCVYLLLEQANGGKLYDYIHSYVKSTEYYRTLTETKLLQCEMKASIALTKTNPIKIPQQQATTSANTQMYQKSRNLKPTEESFFHLLRSYYSRTPTQQQQTSIDCVDLSKSKNTPETLNKAPHFDLIANDPDVDNLVLCSKTLLTSVSNTLQKVKIDLNEEELEISESLFEGYDVDDDNNDDDDDVTKYADGSDGESVQIETIECNDILNLTGQNNIEILNEQLIQLPKAILRRWFREIIFAVKHLHANEIYCYDLQPHNLLLGKNGEIKLTYYYRREFNGFIDFENINKTCYPIAYIAPERPLGQYSDVWSIGVIFYELATGTSFQLCHPNGIHSYYDIQYMDNCDIDENTKDLLEGLLQVNPDDRLRLDEIEAHPFFTST